MDVPAGATALLGFAVSSLLLITVLVGFCVHYLRGIGGTQAFLAVAAGPARPFPVHDTKKGHVTLHLEEPDRRRWFVGEVRALPRAGRLHAAEPVGPYDRGDYAEYSYGKPVRVLKLDESRSSELFKVKDVKALQVTIRARADRRISINYKVDL